MKRFVSLFMAMVMMLGVIPMLEVNAVESDNYVEFPDNNGSYDSHKELPDNNGWYEAYSELIICKKYGHYMDYYTSDPEFSLYDLDFDGNPELLTTFADSGFGPSHYVYTVKNKYPRFVGMIGSRDGFLFHHMNSSYRGLYCHSGRMGHYESTYYYMKNYKIVQKPILSTVVMGNSKPQISVNNSTLYKAYKKATNYDKDTYKHYGMRKPRYRLDSRAGSKIESVEEFKEFVDSSKYLAIPKIKSFENIESGVKLKWKAVKGAEKYKVYMKAGSKWKTIGVTSGTSIVHKTDKSGKKYTYTIKCVSKDGYAKSQFISKGFSNTFIATPQPRVIQKKTDGLRFVFNRVDGATKYRVFRKTKGTGWKKVGDVSAKKDYFLDKTAKIGETYSYTVRCISSDSKKYLSAYNKKGLTITR